MGVEKEPVAVVQGRRLLAETALWGGEGGPVRCRWVQRVWSSSSEHLGAGAAAQEDKAQELAVGRSLGIQWCSGDL